MKENKVEVHHTVKNSKRVESYHNTKKIWMNKVSNEKLIVLFLSEIAGSLAVIADCMTAKKDGDME